MQLNRVVITGMGAVSPHPLETPELIEMAGNLIARPLIQMMKERKLQYSIKKIGTKEL